VSPWLPLALSLSLSLARAVSSCLFHITTYQAPVTIRWGGGYTFRQSLRLSPTSASFTCNLSKY
jgi:hypothetical protein